MRKCAMPNRMTTKSPLPVFLSMTCLRCLISRTLAVLLTQQVDWSTRMSWIALVAGWVDAKENDLDERQRKKVIIGTVSHF